MEVRTQKSFIERVRNPIAKDSPFGYAKELTRLKIEGDFEGMRAVYDSYVVGIGLGSPNKPFSEVEEMARTNLLMAGKLADLVVEHGYEGTGQLLALAFEVVDPEGPITKFYRESIDFPKD